MGRIKSKAKSQIKGIKHPQMTQMNTDEKAKAKTTGSRLKSCRDDGTTNNDKQNLLDRG
jgi:hypothetical protein